MWLELWHVDMGLSRLGIRETDGWWKHDFSRMAHRSNGPRAARVGMRP